MELKIKLLLINYHLWHFNLYKFYGLYTKKTDGAVALSV